MKKRTCNNCKAFDIHGKCMLEFQNDNGVPKEECPKPKSWKQYIRYECEKHNESIRKRK